MVENSSSFLSSPPGPMWMGQVLVRGEVVEEVGGVVWLPLPQG